MAALLLEEVELGAEAGDSDRSPMNNPVQALQMS